MNARSWLFEQMFVCKPGMSPCLRFQFPPAKAAAIVHVRLENMIFPALFYIQSKITFCIFVLISEVKYSQSNTNQRTFWLYLNLVVLMLSIVWSYCEPCKYCCFDKSRNLTKCFYWMAFVDFVLCFLL